MCTNNNSFLFKFKTHSHINVFIYQCLFIFLYQTVSFLYSITPTRVYYDNYWYIHIYIINFNKCHYYQHSHLLTVWKKPCWRFKVEIVWLLNTKPLECPQILKKFESLRSAPRFEQRTSRARGGDLPTRPPRSPTNVISLMWHISWWINNEPFSYQSINQKLFF